MLRAVLMAITVAVLSACSATPAARPVLPKNAAVAISSADFQVVRSRVTHQLVAVPRGNEATFKVAAGEAVVKGGFGMIPPGSRVTLTVALGPGTVVCNGRPYPLGAATIDLLDTDGNVMLRSATYHPQRFAKYAVTFTLPTTEAASVAVVLQRERKTLPCGVVDVAPAMALVPKPILRMQGPHVKRRVGEPSFF